MAIEKGFEDPRATSNPAKLMNRGIWDWPRLVQQIEAVLTTDLVAVADSVEAPLNLRINTRQVVDGKSTGWEMRAFSYVEGRWFERYVGDAEPQIVADYVREVDEKRDTWVIVHFAQDLSPAEANGLSASQLAAMLMQFDALRGRLHGSFSTSAAV